MLLALISALAGLFPLAGFKSATQESNAIVVPSDRHRAEVATWPTDAPQIASRQKFTPHPDWGIRNSTFNSRATREMRQLLDQYIAAPFTSKLFGLASDVSVVRGQGSSVWYRVFTDFGLIGFLWLFLLFAARPAMLWKKADLHFGTCVFILIFLLSFYQRPIIWLPAQLLIYFAGLAWGSGLTSTRAEPAARRAAEMA
jgi:hypothetical protein